MLLFPQPAAQPAVDDDTAIDRRVEPEERISDCFTDYVDSGSSGPGYFLSRPRRAVELLRDLRRLPVLEVAPSAGPAGLNLRSALPRPIGPGHWFGHRSVLELPDTLESYLDGPAKQTLRRKARQAQKQGVTWRPVDTPAERRRVLTAAALWEQQVSAEADVGDLGEHDLWLAAYDADGSPLLLAVIPVDGDWAVLRYYRTIGTGTAQSTARYLMMQALAEVLIDRGVHHLVDAIAPAALGNSLRHFQRLIGFRIVRISTRPTPRTIP